MTWSSPFKVIGVDVSPKIVNNARKKAPGLHCRVEPTKSNAWLCCRVRFEVADAWSATQLLGLGVQFDVIFLDIGGISGHDGILESLTLIRHLSSLFKSSLQAIVVKSRCLRDNSISYIHAGVSKRPKEAKVSA